MKPTWGVWQELPPEGLGAVDPIPGAVVMLLEEDIAWGSSGRDPLAQSGRPGACPRGGLVGRFVTGCPCQGSS